MATFYRGKDDGDQDFAIFLVPGYALRLTLPLVARYHHLRSFKD